MIHIKNSQRTIKINVSQIRTDATSILTILGYKGFDLGILFTTNKIVQEYNKEYRQKDKPTDILSFPYHPELKAGERIVPQSPEDKNLGDIIMSPEYILADLPQWGMNFEQRLRVLLIHGICHLLGYDHIEDADYEVMNKQEHMLLKELEKNN